MRMLQHSSGIPRLPDVYAEVHLLRCPADSDAGSFADSGIRMLGAAQGRTVRLGQVWPFGDGDSGSGQRFDGPWPGAIYGVRPPEPEETPLSWAEVQHAKREQII